jgi:hypothetical protein
MPRKLILPLLSLTLGLTALQAAPIPCTTATLSAYVGAAACSIGSVVVSDFTLLPNLSGAPDIGAANITVTPTASTYTQTLEFRTSSSATGSLLGASFEQIFTFLVSPLGTFTNASISLLDSMATGDGVVVGTQLLCQGGALAADGSSCAGAGDFLSNSVLTIDGGTPDLLSASFLLAANSSPLFVRNEFVVDGGSSGTASAGALTNSFTAVPEPATVSLVGSLLVGAAFFGRRKSA